MPSKTEPSTPSGLSSVFSRNGGQHRLLDPVGAVLAQVPGHLASAHREAAEDDVCDLELLEQLLEIRGIGVVVLAGGRLARLAPAPPVVRDHAIASVQQSLRLPLPGV